MPSLDNLNSAVDDFAAAADVEKFTGMAVTAVSGEDHVVRGFGKTHADGATPAADTVFEIGPVTKVFTSLLLAHAAVTRQLPLDTKLADLIPQAAGLQRDGVDVTLAHLASHTSGLPRLPKGMLRDQLFGRGNPSNPYAGLDEATLLAGLERTRVKSMPGDRHMYSNLGAGLLGLALQRFADVDYQTLVDAVICRPLDMVDTAIVLDDSQFSRFATGHDQRGREVASWNLNSLAPAGALRSSARDMRTFLQAQLGLTAVAEPLQAAMQLSRDRFVGLDAGGHGCLGWTARPLPDDQTLYVHSGVTGGFSCFVGLIPQCDVAVAVSANCARDVDLAATRLAMSLTR